MATIFAPPKEMQDPKIDYRGDWRKQEKEYLDKLKELCIKHGEGENRGEVIKFPMADSYAMYMVYTDTSLIHLPLGDAWDIPDAHARGLEAKDIDDMVRREKHLQSMFAEPSM